MQSAMVLIEEGRQARARGDRDTARARYAEAATQYRREGRALAWAHATRHVADMWLEDSQYDLAQALYEEALETYRQSLETRVLDLANTLRPYALLQEAIGNPRAAVPLWQEARNLYASLRVREGVAECELHLSSFAQASGS